MSRHAKAVGVYVILTFFAVTTLIPFLWMVFTSFKPLQEIEFAAILPKKWEAGNYAGVFEQIPFARYYLNSVLVAGWVTFLTCCTSATAAYAFSRLRWKGRDHVFRLYLATLMIPGVVTMIPNYTIMVKLHLLDTYTGLIVPAAFGAFGTFLLRQFMLGIPDALDEAANLDGATPWIVFWEIVVPLARPGIIALAILTFLGNYGSFYWPLILIKSDQLRTLPIGLMYFDGLYDKQTNLLMAASVMSLLPPILIYIVGQKFLVSGLTIGAVKG